MTDKMRILCIGEVLWDALPAGLFLGGAPLNVCYHLNQLGASADMCSRVGDDRLGKEALHRIEKKGISPEYIQSGDEAETGFVEVTVTEDGEPSYNIIEPAAWDFIEPSRTLKKEVEKSWGLVFGSLAQRSDRSRTTIQDLWQHANTKILDLNLRPPNVDKEIVHGSLHAADIVKMNEDELIEVSKWLSFSGDTRQLVLMVADEFDCSFICITRGAGGAVLFREGNWFEHPGYQTNALDTVGAGDAFLAAMIYGVQERFAGEKLLEYANAAGSLVAQKSGATPEYNMSSIQEIITG